MWYRKKDWVQMTFWVTKEEKARYDAFFKRGEIPRVIRDCLNGCVKNNGVLEFMGVRKNETC